MNRHAILATVVMAVLLLAGCKPPPLHYWEIIDKEGNVVYRPPHPMAWPPSYESGLISFEKNGKLGYRDRQGRIIIPPVYELPWCCDDDLITVYKDRQRIVFNGHGIKVAPVKHVEFDMKLIEKKLAAKGLKVYWAAPTDDGQLLVLSGEKVGLYDVKTDKIVIQPKFERLYYFEDDFAAAKINGEWGLVGKTGRFIIPPQFKDREGDSPFYYLERGLIGVYQNGLWGFINAQGKFVIKPQFSDIGAFHNGLIWVKVNDLWGAINTRGEFVVKPQFSAVGILSEGLISVYQNRLWGFVNTKGKMVINPQFSSVEDFSDGAAAAKKAMPADSRNLFEILGGINEPPELLYGYIDKSGKFITPQIYFEARPFKKGLAAVSLGIAKRQKSK